MGREQNSLLVRPGQETIINILEMLPNCTAAQPSTLILCFEESFFPQTFTNLIPYAPCKCKALPYYRSFCGTSGPEI